MHCIDCTLKHVPAITSILNEAIVNSTAVYDYRPRSLDWMQQWYQKKRAADFPIIGMQTDDGELIGFATFGPFRAFPAYKYSVEHSVYVDARFRGQGIGRTLLCQLIELCRAEDYHMMIGGIDGTNQASISLHQALGFEHCATIQQAAYKFGRWLDLQFYQLILPTPAAPSELDDIQR